MNEIQGKKILILGFGKEGQSTLSYLKKHHPDLDIEIADQKEIEITNKHIKTHIGKDYLNLLQEFDTVIRTPGIPNRLPEIQNYIKSGKHLTSATNIFFSQVKSKTIGITGTKGKSTTTSLIYHILKSSFPNTHLVGNIGIPMLDLLDKLNSESIVVAELSSHQLEDCRYSPHIAVLLEIVPEHLDHAGTFENYILSKSNITYFQNSTDYLVFNPAHIETNRIAQETKATKITFSLTNKDSFAYAEQGTLYLKPRVKVIDVNEIPLISRGNQENSLAAISTCSIFNIPVELITSHLKTFQPLEHRLELVGKFKEIIFYNDSISTTPQSTINAIDAFADLETLIVGGYDRGLDFSPLVDKILDSKIKNLILLPTTGEAILAKIKDSEKSYSQIKISSVKTMDQAVEFAFKETSPNKICLLSPAASSYTSYTSFEERGNHFKNLIKETK